MIVIHSFHQIVKMRTLLHGLYDAVSFASQIIRDIQLMVFVAVLILVDIVVLTAWHLTDPVRCSRSVRAAVEVRSNCQPTGLTSKIWTAIVLMFCFFNHPNKGDGERCFLLTVATRHLFVSVLRPVANYHWRSEGKYCLLAVIRLLPIYNHFRITSK